MAALTELQKTNYVLGTFMLVIALSAIAQIIYYLRGKQPKSKPMILLFIIVCSHAIVRAVYNFLPSIVYKNMMLSKQGMTKIMTLDLFPETIFLLMFWLLVCTWMETWIRVRTWKKEVKKVFWWVFPVGCAIIGISLIITIACSTRKTYTYIEIAKQEYNYIVTFIGVIMGSALIFGVLVYRVFREITIKPGESTHRKRQSFLKLVIISSLSLIVKAVYLGTMSLVIRDRRTKGEISNVQFAIIWFFYYAVTEMMPSIAVLSVFVDNQRRGKSLGSTSHTATGNENGPNSVPLSIKASSDDGTVLSSAKASTEDLDGITTGSNAEMTKEDEDELSASDSEDV